MILALGLTTLLKILRLREKQNKLRHGQKLKKLLNRKREAPTEYLNWHDILGQCIH